MLMIRFQRIGRTNDPAFRILVLEKTRSPKAGTYTDLLGTYNPKTKALTIAEDRLKHWMKQGAQVSPSLTNLLITKKILEGKKISTLSKKNLEKNIAKEAEVTPAETAPVEETAEPQSTPTEETAETTEAPTEEAVAPGEEVTTETPAA